MLSAENAKGLNWNAQRQFRIIKSRQKIKISLVFQQDRRTAFAKSVQIYLSKARLLKTPVSH